MAPAGRPDSARQTKGMLNKVVTEVAHERSPVHEAPTAPAEDLPDTGTPSPPARSRTFEFVSRVWRPPVRPFAVAAAILVVLAMAIYAVASFTQGRGGGERASKELTRKQAEPAGAGAATADVAVQRPLTDVREHTAHADVAAAPADQVAPGAEDTNVGTAVDVSTDARIDAAASFEVIADAEPDASAAAAAADVEPVKPPAPEKQPGKDHGRRHSKDEETEPPKPPEEKKPGGTTAESADGKAPPEEEPMPEEKKPSPSPWEEGEDEGEGSVLETGEGE